MPVQKVFNGTDWVSVDGGGGASGDYIEGEGISKIYVSGTQPTVSESGDLWLDTNSQSASGIAYLPLSAGVDHPLTGTLWADNQQSDSPVKARMLATDVGAYFEGYYNGAIQGGLSTTNDSRTIVYGNGNSVVLRPNGRGDTNGQVSFGIDGQQIGGHPVVVDESTTTRNPSAQSYYAISYKVLGEGLWSIQYQVYFSPTSAGTFACQASLGSSNTDGKVMKQTIYCGNTYEYGISCNALLSLGGNTTVTFQTWGQNTYQIKYTKIVYTRLA